MNDLKKPDKDVKLWIKAVLFFAKYVFRIVYPLKIEGEENIPKDGACMICPNHVHAIDPIQLHYNIQRRIIIVGKAELFGNKAVGPVIKACDAIPVERGKADLSAVRKCLEVLRNGGALCIFPQGTRSPDNTPTPLQTGAAMIRQRALCPMIPVYIDAPYRLFRRTRVVIGKPLELDVFGKKGDSETVEKITEKLNDALWSLK